MENRVVWWLHKAPEIGLRISEQGSRYCLHCRRVYSGGTYCGQIFRGTSSQNKKKTEENRCASMLTLMPALWGSLEAGACLDVKSASCRNLLSTQVRDAFLCSNSQPLISRLLT